MNQILVSEKLYITPELRRKKRLFRIEFFLSVFLVCILSSYYIYAEYDRNKNEQLSREVLAEVQTDNTIKQEEEDDSTLIIVLGEEEANKADDTIAENTQITTNTYTATDGTKYSTEAVVSIPSIDISYPVLTETSDDLLEISVNKYFGPNPNEIGNYCIVGHNYRNGKMFGRLSELENGDVVELQDLSGRTVKYKVYNRYVVKPTDTRCTSQKYCRENAKRELTLITCTNYGTERLVVKCREV